MKALRYQLRHLPILASWLKARGLEHLGDEMLPEIGWVVEHLGESLCAGFLRRVEGDGYAIFDSIVSNPDAPGELRNQALDLLYETAIQEGERLGITRIIGFTVDENTCKRSIRHGFITPPHALLILDRTKRHL